MSVVTHLSVVTTIHNFHTLDIHASLTFSPDRSHLRTPKFGVRLKMDERMNPNESGPVCIRSGR